MVIKYVFDLPGDLNDRTGGKVYPLVGAQQDAVPFVIYEVVTVDNVPSKDADSHIDEYLVRFTAVSDTYGKSQIIATTIRTAFVRRAYKVGEVTVASCTFDGLRDLYSDDERTYGAQIDLRFRVTID